MSEVSCGNGSHHGCVPGLLSINIHHLNVHQLPLVTTLCCHQTNLPPHQTSIVCLVHPADKRAAQNKLDREFGWLLDPLTKGDYPDTLKQAIGGDLPQFTAEEKQDLRGSIDFIGVNVYTARYVYAKPDNPLGFKQTTQRNGKDIGFKTNDW